MALEWKDISQVIGKAAPILGTVIGGPAGGAIGALVSQVLGVGNNADAVYEAIKNDPEAAIKLKQLENEKEAMLKSHIENMANIAAKEEEERVKERVSAHQREIETTKAGDNNVTMKLLALIGISCFFGMVAHMLAYGLGDMTKEESFIIGNMTGMVAAIAKDIYGYFFGSSKGSKDKTLHMANKQG